MATATERLKPYGEMPGFVIPNNRDYIVVPAHRSNYSTVSEGRYGAKRRPNYKGITIHTPEEDADDNEVTPRWFANPDANASTQFYLDNDGDLYQCVSVEDIAWAQGVYYDPYVRNGKDMPPNAVKPYPSWFSRDADRSYNLCFLSIEVEGRARTIHETLDVDGPQWATLVAWCAYWCKHLNIPANREHIVGHDELSLWKSDPGFSAWRWKRLINDIYQLMSSSENNNVENTSELESADVKSIQNRLKKIESQLTKLNKWAADYPS